MIKGRDFSQLWNPYTPYCSSSVESILFIDISSSLLLCSPDDMRKLFLHPAITCIEFAPYVHQKSVNWASNLVISLMLIFLTKFVPNSTTRWYSSGINLLNFYAQLAPNLKQILSQSAPTKLRNLHHFIRLMPKRCWLKMHKCLVGIQSLLKL